MEGHSGHWVRTLQVERRPCSGRGMRTKAAAAGALCPIAETGRTGLEKLKVPASYRGMRIIYKYDDGFHDDFNVNDELIIEFYDK